MTDAAMSKSIQALESEVNASVVRGLNEAIEANPSLGSLEDLIQEIDAIHVRRRGPTRNELGEPILNTDGRGRWAEIVTWNEIFLRSTDNRFVHNFENSSIIEAGGF